MRSMHMNITKMLVANSSRCIDLSEFGFLFSPIHYIVVCMLMILKFLICIMSAFGYFFILNLYLHIHFANM